MNKKTIIEMDYKELDELISKEFGIDYECVAYEEWSNGESHEFAVEPNTLDEYNSNNLKTGKLHYLTSGLLDELCFQGKLEAGDYLISVSW